MKLLELFSGTQSVGKVATQLGYDVISLDINDYNGVYTPTHKVDIMEFNYQQYSPDEFDVIWGSPPCLYYSTLQYSWYGRNKKDGLFTKEKHMDQLLIADSWVKKVLEIINYFNPQKWIIENPRTGLLKKREFMKDIPYVDVDYCRYSNWGYKKQTRIWTNITFPGKTCNKNCGNMSGGKHMIDVARDKHKLARYRVPPNLITEILISPNINV